MKRFVALMIVAAGLQGCAPWEVRPESGVSTLTDGFTDYQVTLGPRKNQTMVLPGNAGCVKGSGSKEGCLRFEPGAYGVIRFTVAGNGYQDKKCGDPGVRWVITQVQVADSGDIDTSKSTDFGNPVDPWLENALFPFQDPTTGTVFEAGATSPPSTTFRVINLNNSDPGDEKDFWYKVVATWCDSHGALDPSTTSWTDPRVENDGL